MRLQVVNTCWLPFHTHKHTQMRIDQFFFTNLRGIIWSLFKCHLLREVHSYPIIFCPFVPLYFPSQHLYQSGFSVAIKRNNFCECKQKMNLSQILRKHTESSGLYTPLRGYLLKVSHSTEAVQCTHSASASRAANPTGGRNTTSQ